MIAAVLFLALSQKPVDFTCEAQPLKRVLADFSKAIGQKVEAAAALENKLIVMRVQGMQAGETLRVLAQTLHASIERKGDGYVLRLDPSLVRQRRTELQKILRDRIQEAIQKRLPKAELTVVEQSEILDRLQALGERTGEHDQFDRIAELSEKSPIVRVAWRAIARIGADKLASVPLEGKAVFSTHPNPLQLPLGPDFAKDFDLFVKEQSAWSELASKRNLLEILRQSTDVPAKLTLSVQNEGMGASPSFHVLAYDRRGRVIAYSFSPVPIEPARRRPLDQQTELSKPIEFRKESIPFVRHLQTLWSGGSPPSTEVLQLLLHPERRDPMALATTDVLWQWSKDAGKSLIGLPADATAQFFANLAPLTVPVFARELRRHMDVREDDKWITLSERPDSPVQLPRPLVASLVRASLERGFLDLSTQSQLALEASDSSLYMAGHCYASLARGASPNPSGSSLGFRILGSLTRDQRKAMQTDEGIPVGSLSLAQRTYLLEAIRSLWPPNSRRSGPDLDGSEVTNLFPEGLPMAARLALTESEGVAYFNVPRKVRGSWTWAFQVDPVRLAQAAFAKERPDFAKGRPELDPFLDSLDGESGKFHVGQFQHADLHLRMSRSRELTWNLKASGAGSREFALSELPEDFRKKFTDELERCRKMWANRTPASLEQN